MNTIFELIDDGDADGIRALLAADPAARDLRDDTGHSPLLHAAYRGGGPAFDAILAAGEPTDPWDRLIGGRSDAEPAPDAWTPDGFTPLHLELRSTTSRAASALLAAGADPNVLDDGELRPRHATRVVCLLGRPRRRTAAARARRRSTHRGGRCVHGRGRGDRARERGVGKADRERRSHGARPDERRAGIRRQRAW